MLTDIRFSFRQLMKSPGFTIIATLTLAIGIGANTAIFTLINTLLLKPLPYPDSDRIAQVSLDLRQGPNGFAPVSGGIYLDFQNATQFESLSAARTGSLNLTGIEEPQRLSGLEVSANYLRTYGIELAHGRGFPDDAETAGGNQRVVILSDTVWKQQFGGDLNLIDRNITLDHESYTVVGILPPNAFIINNTDYLVPAAIGITPWKQVRRYDFVCTIEGRLAPGSTLESARAELETIKASLNDQYPDMMKEWGISVRALQDAYFGNAAPFVFTLLIAVGMLLLVACGNVANLLLAKASARQGEIAVRSALGASGWRIARQLLAESGMLAGLGGLVGLVIGIAALKPLSLLVGMNQLPAAEMEIDLRVMAFTLGISIVTGLLFGLLPSLKAARGAISSGLRDSTRATTSAKGNKAQSALIIAEVALTVALLVSIGLLLKSFTNAFQTDPGFRRDHALTFELARSATRSPQAEDYVRFTDQLLERLSEIPGVDSAAMISTTPMNGSNYYGAPFWRDDQPDTANSYFTGFDCINGDVFKTLGIPLLRGRIIEPQDQLPDAPKVLVISQQVVVDRFGEDDPIGQMVHHDNEMWQVVGVVGDTKRFGLNAPGQPMVYKPQIHWPWASSYIIRTQLPPLLIADQVKAAVQSVDPEQPIDRLRTLEEAVFNTLSTSITMASLIGIFAVISVILASIGIYGLMSYLVEQRSREFGIRLAIGADPVEIVKMVVWRGVILAAIGIVVGILAVLGAGRYMAFVLYQVEPYDPVVLASVVAVTLLVTLLACWKPARVASKVSPSEALRLG